MSWWAVAALLVTDLGVGVCVLVMMYREPVGAVYARVLACIVAEVGLLALAMPLFLEAAGGR